MEGCGGGTGYINIILAVDHQIITEPSHRRLIVVGGGGGEGVAGAQFTLNKEVMNYVF